MRIIAVMILLIVGGIAFNLPYIYAELTAKEEQVAVKDYKPPDADIKTVEAPKDKLTELKARLAEREQARAQVVQQYQNVQRTQEDRERTIERFNGSIVELKDQIEMIEKK